MSLDLQYDVLPWELNAQKGVYKQHFRSANYFPAWAVRAQFSNCKDGRSSWNVNVYCTRAASCEDTPGYIPERRWRLRFFYSWIADDDDEFSCVTNFDASPICMFRVNRGQQKSRLNQSFQPYKIFMRVTCASIEHVRRWKCLEAFWEVNQGIKVTSKLLKIKGSRMCGCNLTFDPWKSSNQEPQKAMIKWSNTLFADQKNLIAVANTSTGDI